MVKIESVHEESLPRLSLVMVGKQFLGAVTRCSILENWPEDVEMKGG